MYEFIYTHKEQYIYTPVYNNMYICIYIYYIFKYIERQNICIYILYIYCI